MDQKDLIEKMLKLHEAQDSVIDLDGIPDDDYEGFHDTIRTSPEIDEDLMELDNIYVDFSDTRR